MNNYKSNFMVGYCQFQTSANRFFIKNEPIALKIDLHLFENDNNDFNEWIIKWMEFEFYGMILILMIA